MSLGFSDCLRIVVLGYVIRGPLGGMAWHHLQYVLGLARLGHDVRFLEDSGDSPYCCYDPVRDVTDADPTYGLDFAAHAFGRIGLEHVWAYHDVHTSSWHGPAAGEIPEFCSGADLLINLSASNPVRSWLGEIPVRALIDTDPTFTQIRNATSPERRDHARQHTAFFTFGENVGRTGCGIPDDGFRWQPTRQPIVLDAWRVTPGRPRASFTTVMQWDSYPAREHRGRRYGMKSESFAPFLDLPKKTDSPLELVVGSATAPRELLRSNGWTVRSPSHVVRDPWSYQRYIRRSKGEFSVAKHGYVVSHSGWFSERSACYLASGRPVLTQETGFSDWLPAGSGVTVFSTPDEALAGMEAVNSRYESHCRAARAIAAEYFDARKVLTRLLENAFSNDGLRLDRTCGAEPKTAASAQLPFR